MSGARGVRSALLGFSLLALSTAAACSDNGGTTTPGGSTAGATNCPNDLPDDQDCPAASPSWQTDVSPIVANKCAVCHYANNPYSTTVLLDYAGVYENRRTVLTQVYACRMPAAGADPLTADERQLLLKWLVCGAPSN
jgi:uncharacterized membrane protein